MSWHLNLFTMSWHSTHKAYFAVKAPAEHSQMNTPGPVQGSQQQMADQIAETPDSHSPVVKRKQCPSSGHAGGLNGQVKNIPV